MTKLLITFAQPVLDQPHVSDESVRTMILSAFFTFTERLQQRWGKRRCMGIAYWIQTILSSAQTYFPDPKATQSPDRMW